MAKGTELVQRNLHQILGALPAEAGRALYEEAEIEMAEMKALTPVDTGALRASGHVNPPEIDGQDITVTLGFGGPSADYAIYVHEDLEAFHPVGQAKFMEAPLTQSAPYLYQRVAKRIDLNRLAS